MNTSDNWFTLDAVDENTYIISEYRHPEETHCYLLIGDDRALLIDTGLGICDISPEVRRLTDKPITAVATHIHWDHIGGHHYFPDFYAHPAELAWLQGAFPLPVEAVRKMLTQSCDLPAGYDVRSYALFQGTPTRLLQDGDQMDLGGRSVQVIHTPGHSPGHLCFWEAERGYLFSGDLVYKGTLYANYPSTDPAAFLESLDKVAQLPVKRILPGHHDLNIQPALLIQMRDAFQGLKEAGKLHHGSGFHQFEDWAAIF